MLFLSRHFNRIIRKTQLNRTFSSSSPVKKLKSKPPSLTMSEKYQLVCVSGFFGGGIYCSGITFYTSTCKYLERRRIYNSDLKSGDFREILLDTTCSYIGGCCSGLFFGIVSPVLIPVAIGVSPMIIYKIYKD